MNAASTNLHTFVADRVRRLGNQPLLTYYDSRSGERTELGWATCANWATKAANLLEESGVASGDDVVIATDGHWTALVATLACGLVGARAVLVEGAPSAGGAPLAVLHERWDDVAAGGSVLLIGPGLGGRTTTGTGTAFVDDVLQCEDEHDDREPEADADWLVLPDGRTLSRSEALHPDERGGRVLLTPPLEAIMPFVTAVLAAGGSLVAVRGDDGDVPRIFDNEHCERMVTHPPGPSTP